MRRLLENSLENESVREENSQREIEKERVKSGSGVRENNFLNGYENSAKKKKVWIKSAT